MLSQRKLREGWGLGAAPKGTISRLQGGPPLVSPEMGKGTFSVEGSRLTEVTTVQGEPLGEVTCMGWQSLCSLRDTVRLLRQWPFLQVAMWVPPLAEQPSSCRSGSGAICWFTVPHPDGAGLATCCPAPLGQLSLGRLGRAGIGGWGGLAPLLALGKG